MNPPSVDARLLELLVRASSLELFQLNVAIDRMLADPRRIVQVRKDLHLGQTVRFMDWRDGQMRAGKVVVMKDTHLTIHEDGARTSWAVPYAAVEPPALCASKRGAAAEPPSVPRSKRNGFRCGGKVAFEDEYLNTVVGTIVRINQRTATIDPGDGTSWLVAFADLRHATLSTSDLAAVIAQDLPCACADLHVKRRPVGHERLSTAQQWPQPQSPAAGSARAEEKQRARGSAVHEGAGRCTIDNTSVVLAGGYGSSSTVSG